MHQIAIALGLFYQVQIGALQVFDQRHFARFDIADFVQQRGDFRQPRQLRSAEAAFAGDQLKHIPHLAQPDRFQHALFADGGGQLLQSIRREHAPRLPRAGLDFLHRHAPHLILGRRHRRGSRGGGRARRRLAGFRRPRATALD